MNEFYGYINVCYLQGEEAEPIIELLNIDHLKALEALQDYYTDNDNITLNPQWGSSDILITYDQDIIIVNFGIPYIGYCIGLTEAEYKAMVKI